MKNLNRKSFIAVFLLVVLFALTACGELGPNGSSWRMVSGHSERSINNGFVVTVGSASSGQRNRTFNLTSAELSSIHVNSTSQQGQILLIISQDGAEDGTETRLDISNFDGYVPTSLNAGRIRFSLLFEDISGSETTIRWGL